ncbi:MAG: glucosyl transferase [Candidatus Andersenbacteria bacterium CG10_big_fil_rev_8_21_14_0_10_54_11]|uniref:Glucosyl transferase n=1 Tax=Candidatus Andersenbacteria bacterium CG10_big_fil_rev_8_21_14_0_10_54_11 TaxID=1974485 RepID=A0A2M6WYB4_9BACT|nr:MAG: glucosyl transferase [Candidatus Andersenbacteria bacterium CG10_big_fil_rev_8_21_14_0_10_54_11]
MNILIATDTYPPHVNGAAYFTARLAHGLADRGHHVQVVAPSRHWRHELYRDGAVSVAGVPSIPLRINNMRAASAAAAGPVIRTAWQSAMPSVVHVQGHFGLSRAVARTARRMAVPVVGTNHFMAENLSHYLPLTGPMLRRWENYLWQQCYSFFASIDAVTTPTHTARALFTEHGFLKPVQVISNGIDTQRFAPGPASADIRRQYHLPAHPLALLVGRLDKEKNIADVLLALAAVCRRTAFHAVIVGSAAGGEARRLRAAVRRLGLEQSVTFTGFVPDDDLPRLYRCADFFIMAGTAELQSIATMEAMASGLPIIAARAVALPELVFPEENGLLFTPHDHRQLAEHLFRLARDVSLARRFGAASRRLIQTHALDTVLDQFEQCYRTVQRGY